MSTKKISRLLLAVIGVGLSLAPPTAAAQRKAGAGAVTAAGTKANAGGLTTSAKAGKKPGRTATPKRSMAKATSKTGATLRLTKATTFNVPANTWLDLRAVLSQATLENDGPATAVDFFRVLQRMGLAFDFAQHKGRRLEVVPEAYVHAVTPYTTGDDPGLSLAFNSVRFPNRGVHMIHIGNPGGYGDAARTVGLLSQRAFADEEGYGGDRDLSVANDGFATFFRIRADPKRATPPSAW